MTNGTRTGRRKRRALKVALGLATTLFLVLVSLPVWFPWLLAPVLNFYGLSYERYQRTGYTQFELHTIRGDWANTHLRVSHVGSSLPTVWLWRRLRPDPVAPPFALVSDWSLTVDPSPTNSAPITDESTFRILNLVSQIGAILNAELDTALLTNGTIRIPSFQVQVPQARWRAGRLETEVRSEHFPGILQTATVHSDPESISISVNWPAQRLTFRGTLDAEPEAWTLASTIAWRTNQAALSSRFEPAGWWPARGSLRIDQWPVPPEFLPTNIYSQAAASVAVNTTSNRFEMTASGHALPSTSGDDMTAPDLKFSFNVRGNTEHASIEALEVEGPWIELKLINRIGLRRSPFSLTNAAQLQMAADLARIPGLSLTGRVAGTVTTLPDPDRPLFARFDLTAAGVHGWNIETRRALLRGELRWPELQIETASAELADGSQLELTGEANLNTRVTRNGSWNFHGRLPQPLARAIPHENLQSKGNFNGPWTNLNHAGELAFDRLHIPGLRPLNIATKWQGERTSLRSLTGEARAGDSSLSFAGSARQEPTAPFAASLALDAATFRRKHETLYALQRTAEFHYRSAATNTNGLAPANLRIEHFDWAGSNRLIQLAANLSWPKQGQLQATVRNGNSELFSEFIPASVPPVLLHGLDVTGQWSNSLVRLNASMAATWTPTSGPPVKVTALAQAGDQVTIERLTVETKQIPSMTGQGTLPFSIVPSDGTNWLQANETAPLQFEAQLNPVSDFSVPIGSGGQLRLVRPNVRAAASGTFARPKASLRLDAESLEWMGTATNTVLPRLEQISINAAIDEQSIQLSRFQATIDGRGLSLEGGSPLEPGFWKGLVEARVPPDFSRAFGRLQIEQARLATLTRYAPNLLAPDGTLSADVTLQPGRQLEGFIQITNAATRPLGKLSPLRNMGATTRFNGQTAVLESFTGQLSGQPVRATGKFTIPDEGSPAYDVRFQGTNLPLARSVEFLLRGDFDLSFKGRLDTAPTVAGDLTLRDGLFVQHATALMLTRPERPDLRPPYFSVTNRPFADWKLDVNVRGTRFLRIRTPLFNGIGSANLNLRGTLAGPVVTGDLRADSGRVLFPFGTLQLDQAHATFDGNDPRGPDILINASGRNYRYDVRLEVNGPADGANVLFSATPPLNSEEILLMFTAGELPRNENIFSTEARAGRLATFFGRDLISRYSGSESSGERLIINSGENITDEGKTTYSVEYQLTDRWSLIGEYDRFSALNAAVKWRIYSR